MPNQPATPPGATPRRAFLRLAALAPLAAGCAAVRGAAARVGPAPAEPAAGPTPATGAAEALEAVRAFPLDAEAEPASVFRAVVARGRGR